VSGVEATQYLETKGVAVLFNPSDYMAMTKKDFKERAKPETGFLVPSDTPGRHPKILKYADGMASVGMDNNSVCYSDEAVQTKLAELKEAMPDRDVVVQDFIRGIECTAIVMEMGDDVVALPPVEWVFDSSLGLKEDDKWLKFDTKFNSLANGDVTFEFVRDPKRADRISRAAVATFKGLGMQGRGAWGRLDARIDKETEEVYCLEMNHMPSLFYDPRVEHSISDDFIISDTFPGGHQGFVDMLIYTKQCQMKKNQAKRVANGANGKNGHANGTNGHSNGSNGHSNGTNGHSNGTNGHTNGGHAEQQPQDSEEGVGLFKASGATIAQVYDSASALYDDVSVPIYCYRERLREINFWDTYSYVGTTLDLGCGTGYVGRQVKASKLIKSLGVESAILHGVDISPMMLQIAGCQTLYETVQVGLIQDVLMDPTSLFVGGPAGQEKTAWARPVVDHVTAFGMLHFLNPVEFGAVFSRAFFLARRSVTFDVTDVPKVYIDRIIDAFGENLRNHNHMADFKRLGTPPGWKKVYEEEMKLWRSPTVDMDISGIVVRFERLE
jgi:SAM-dependent methyltransferase